MKVEDIFHPWPPNIQKFEQTFFGISMVALMGGGLGGLVMFLIFSQMIGGLGGMILGAVLGFVTFGTVALCTTKLEAFHNMYLPQYLIVRYRDSKNSKTLELPLILASGNQKISIEDWDGNEEGVLE